MKKIITIALSLLLSLFALVGCGEAEFDYTETVVKLEENGYVQTVKYDTRAQIDYISSQLNEKIKANGEDLWVSVQRYAPFVMTNDSSLYCRLIEFATEEQAQGYAKFYLATRPEGSADTIAQRDNAVVITNAANVRKNLNLEFK